MLNTYQDFNFTMTEAMKLCGNYLSLFASPLLIIAISGLILWIWELNQPFQKLQLISIFLQDLKELPIILLFIVLSAQAYASIESYYILPLFKAAGQLQMWEKVVTTPLWLRVVIAILLKDFIAYYYHWFMHRNIVLWRSHKWHHMQEQMYWLKGNKNSLIAKFIAKWDLIGFALLGIPLRVTFIFITAYSFFTFFVHSNVQWKPWMKYMEWIFVTPRYHLVHHSSNIELQQKNLGDVFTLCDRIFGTYVDPGTFDVDQEKFGLNKAEPLTVKAILGI